MPVPEPPEDPDALTMRRRGVGRWLWLAGGLLLAVAGLWWMTHPTALPTGQPRLETSTPVTVPLYIGVLGPSVEGGERTLHLSDVTVPIAEDPGTGKATAFVCHGGSIAQTSDPSAFCPDLEEAKGATLQLGAGDQLVISVESHTEGILRVDPLLVTYREGLQFATQPTGPTVVVTVLGR